MKPDRERLKELKDKLIKYMNVCNYALETGEDKLIIALIDAALAEPDADVAEAIEFWEKIKRQSIQCIEKSQNGKSYHVNLLPTMDNAGALDLAITALRQYQKPTDEAVSVAIWYQDSHIQKEECRWRDVSEEDDCEPGARNFHEKYIDAHKLAIQALRQMRSEPCEWCEGKEDSLLVWTKEPCEIEWDDREYATKGWTWKELKTNYCPNCGRKLVK